MEIQGERVIAADRATVWRALNDPDVLRACIPGCEELEKTSPTTFEGQVTQKVGPVKAKFKGAIELSDIVENESYRIDGEGKGGAAGFAKGGATVRLDDAPEGTQLSYDVDAKVGGKLAQLGSRLIEGFARKQADAFFERFKDEVEGGGEAATPVDGAPDAIAAEEAAPAVAIDQAEDAAREHPAEEPGAAGATTRDDPVSGQSMSGEDPVASQETAGPAGGTDGAYQAQMSEAAADMAAAQDDPDRAARPVSEDPAMSEPEALERVATDGVVGEAGADPARVAGSGASDETPVAQRAEPRHQPAELSRDQIRGTDGQDQSQKQQKGWFGRLIDTLLGR